jgi:ribonuclease P protein component
VSKRAVRRNRLRRLLLQQILHHPPSSPSPIWLVFSLKPGSNDAEEALLLGECLELLRKAELR